MASSTSVDYSKSELRALSILQGAGRLNTDELIKKFYARRDRPFHARQVVVSVMRSLIEKASINKEQWRVSKSNRAGPNSIEFWIERRAK